MIAINKKIVVYVIIGLVLVGAATAATVLVLKSINGGVEKTKTVITKESAQSLRDKAEEARKNNDNEKAESLLLEAQQQYEELPKTDETTNALVDIEAQLFTLENVNKNP